MPSIPRYEIVVSPLGDATPVASPTGEWCQYEAVSAALRTPGKCGSCHWWSGDEDSRSGKYDWAMAECRRRAPVITGSQPPWQVAKWPRTRIGDGCGEFSPYVPDVVVTETRSK